MFSIVRPHIGRSDGSTRAGVASPSAIIDGTSGRTSTVKNVGSVAYASPCSASSGLILRILCTSASYVIPRASYHVMFGSRLHVHVMLCHPEPVLLQHFTFI